MPLVMYLVDTKVFSGARKGQRANMGIRAFFAKAGEQDWPLFFASIAIINRESSQGLAIPLGSGISSPAQGFCSLISSSNTARASLSWSRLREVSARRNRH